MSLLLYSFCPYLGWKATSSILSYALVSFSSLARRPYKRPTECLPLQHWIDIEALQPYFPPSLSPPSTALSAQAYNLAASWDAPGFPARSHGPNRFWLQGTYLYYSGARASRRDPKVYRRHTATESVMAQRHFLVGLAGSCVKEQMSNVNQAQWFLLCYTSQLRTCKTHSCLLGCLC